MKPFIRFFGNFNLIALIVALSSTMSYATPSTHIWAPSADIQTFMVMHLTSDIYVPLSPNKSGTFVSPVTNIGLTAGVLPFKKIQGEVGFDHIAGFGSADYYPIYFNAKVGIPEGALGSCFPAAAVGVYSVGTMTGSTDYNIMYGKIAKTFGHAGKFSLGYYSGNDKLLFDSMGNKDATGIMACWEKLITEISDKLWIAVEYMGGGNSYGSLNFGISWAFSDKTSVLIGYNDYNNSSLPSTYTIQTDVNF